MTQAKTALVHKALVYRALDRARAAALIAVLAAACGASAQVYKVTDGENGVVFTDRPETIDSSNRQTIEELTIPETNTVTPIAPQPRSPAQSERAEKKDPVIPSVDISAPPNESTIAMGPGNFGVSARPVPPLSGSEKLLLFVDGQAFGAPQSSTTWFLEGMLRGPHDLVVRRLSGGQSIASSEPVRVYVLRPSILNR